MRRDRYLATLLALLVVASVVAPVAVLATAGTTTAATESSTSSSSAPGRAPDGHAGVPGGNVVVDRGSGGGHGPGGQVGDGVLPNGRTFPGAAAWGLTASEHPADLHAEITAPGGRIRINLTDDVNHDGREVAVNASALVEATGEKPETAYGRAENGSRWTAPITYSGGMAVWSVPHFSTQTVEFSGEVELGGSPATNGTTHTYDLGTLDGVSNLDVNVTGVLSSAWANESAGGLSDGSAMTLDVGGNLAPTGPSASGEPVVEFVGERTGVWRNVSAAGVFPAATHSLGLEGNVQPEFPDANGEPKITLTNVSESITNGDRTDYEDDISYYTNENIAFEIHNPPGAITEFTIYRTGSSGGTVDFRLSKGEVDNTFGEGTLVASDYTLGSQSGSDTVTLSEPFDTGGGEVEVEMIGQDASGDEGVWKAAVDVDETSETGVVKGGGLDYSETAHIEATDAAPTGLTATGSDGSSHDFATATEGETGRLDLSAGTASVDWSATGGGSFDYELDMQDVNQTEDPSLDLGGDGSVEASHSGLLADGETATYELDSLDRSTSTVDVGLGGGTVGATIRVEEHTETRNPSVSVNGHSVGHSGALADGETSSLAADESWIVEGSNTVTVEVDDPASGPSGKVRLDYSHDASALINASVEAGKWIERFNASRTYEDDRAAASVSIDFAETVIAVGYVEQRVNGGEWQTVTDYSLDGTDLTVELGSVDANDEVEVRAEGRKVAVSNGAIDVVDPTVPGDDLDTKIEVTSRSDGFAIGVSGTTDRVPYLASPSWTANAYTLADASGGQELHLPDTNGGSTARVRSSSLAVTPDTGEIEVVVEDATEPQFRLRKGDSAGASKVNVTYFDTATGTTYRLYSVTQDREVASATAESPVSFLTDGDAETYLVEIKPASGGGGSSAAVSVGSDDPLGLTILFAGVAVSMVGFYWVGRRLGARSTTANALLVIGGAVVGLVAVELVTPRSITSDSLFAIGEAVGGFAGTGAGTVVIGLAILLGVYLLRGVLPIPRWFVLVAGLGDAVWVLDSLSGGGLLAGLEELGPLLWLLLIGGGLVLLWRAFQPTIVNVGGERQ